MAGFTYQMQVDPASDLVPGGTWEADCGTIDAWGNYTVPSYLPPNGEDRITYTDPNDESAHIDIFVVPDPDVPSTGYPRYISYATGAKGAPDWNVNPSAQLIGNNGQVLASGLLIDLVASNPHIAVVEGAYPADFLAVPVLTDCVDVAVATDVTAPAGHRALRATVVNELREAPDTTLIVVSTALPDKAKPKNCKPGPMFGIPLDAIGDKHCIGGPLYVDGPPKTEGPTIIPPPQTGSMEFTAGIKGGLDAAGLGGLSFGFNIGVTYPMTRTLLLYKQKKFRDVWCCRDSYWTFCGTQACTRSGQGEWTVPKWVAFVDQYPINGAPDPSTWTSWNCG